MRDRQYHLRRFASTTGEKIGLALVGTVHFDRKSYYALTALLRALDSSIIATEMSDWGISFRHGRGRQLKGQLLRYVRRNGLLRHEAGELAALISLLSFPHEYLAARTVSRATKARLVHLGRNRDSIAWLGPLLKEHWDEHQLDKLAATGRQLAAKLSYQRERALKGDTVGITPGPRDRRFARRIKGILSKSKTASAVLGWEHVTREVNGNVASLLEYLNPVGLLVVNGNVLRLY